MGKYYVAYYRVSTERQGESGLGLSSQKEHVRSYVESVGGIILDEFMEVESGGNVDRKYLNEAIRTASEHKATLVVKRMDRLTRDGFRITSRLEDLGIPYVDCESPNDTGLVKNIKLAVAKDEKDRIGSRIGDAMDEIKRNIDTQGYHISRTGRKITTLGNTQNLGGELAIRNSVATRRLKAGTNPDNIRAKGVIGLMRSHGYTYKQIMDFLNSNGFPTSKGNRFSQAQVRNLHKRYD